MDLSKSAKKNRDSVELSQLEIENLRDALSEIHTRLEATMKVWPETRRTLSPALNRLADMEGKVGSIFENLRFLWNQGYGRKWKK